MKICVTVSEGSLNAEVEEEFGHSPLFICVDPETMAFTVHDNVLEDTDIGYGIQTAENLIRLGPDVVITGFIGPHGIKKLQSKNIKVVADEEGTVKERDRIYCESGKVQLCGHTINDVHPYGWLTMPEVIKYSSNIAAAKIALQLGTERYYRYIKSFGFGTRTGVMLPGEVRGLVRPGKNSDDSGANIDGA